MAPFAPTPCIISYYFCCTFLSAVNSPWQPIPSLQINQYFILWNKTENYWTSGPWDEQARIFSLVPEMRLNYIYNFSYVSNDNESCFTYSLYNPSTISPFVMDVSGQIKQLSWLKSCKRWNLFWSQPRQQCQVYAFCGAFGSCNEKSLPFCNCLTGDLLDLQQLDHEVAANGKTMHIRLAASEFSSSSNNMGITIGAVSGSVEKLGGGFSSVFKGKLPDLSVVTVKQLESRGEAISQREIALFTVTDIKPENILLDAELCPKVADFGLANLVGRDFSRVITTMRGTRGCLAPEWISGVAITVKAKVYSYGMMLFELVSRRRNSEQPEDGKPVRPGLNGDAPVEKLSRICRVASWCIQDDGADSSGVLDVNLSPVPRSLQVFGDNQEHVIFFTESSSSQSSQIQSKVSTSSYQAQ
ncbi:hypothetical protein V6N11_072346 [Hibiscus sabdariffa]|uniref:Protein kinase domain-containing protein n=1 Tax=Hibiscus sabdariffa TaxID=183260 RepID=A0ABR2U2U6_9ROSI